jgi:hypothetical protein
MLCPVFHCRFSLNSSTFLASYARPNSVPASNDSTRVNLTEGTTNHRLDFVIFYANFGLPGRQQEELPGLDPKPSSAAFTLSKNNSAVFR